MKGVLKDFICGYVGVDSVRNFLQEKLGRAYGVEFLSSEDTQVIQIFKKSKLIMDVRLSPRTREVYVKLLDGIENDVLRSIMPEALKIAELYARASGCRANGIVLAFSNIMDTLYTLVHPADRCTALRASYCYRSGEYESLVENCIVSSNETKCSDEEVARILRKIVDILKSMCT